MVVELYFGYQKEDIILTSCSKSCRSGFFNSSLEATIFPKTYRSNLGSKDVASASAYDYRHDYSCLIEFLVVS